MLSNAVQAANDHLRAMVDANSSLDGMGTTLTAMLSSGTRLGLAHVGDSRAYLLRDGEFSQLTHDQTLVQRMVDEGRITPEQAETHPQRSLLTQALDGRAGVQPDLSVREARRGDRYLLCSDGLSGYVPTMPSPRRSPSPTPDEAAERLIELALQAGAPDNVTVVVADVVDDEPGMPDTPSSAERRPSRTPCPARGCRRASRRSLAHAGGARSPSAKRPGAAQLRSPPPAPPVARIRELRAQGPAVDHRRLPAPGDRRPARRRGDSSRPRPPACRRSSTSPPRRHRRAAAGRWFRRPVFLAFTGIFVVIVAGVARSPGRSPPAPGTWQLRAAIGPRSSTVCRARPLGISLSRVQERGIAAGPADPGRPGTRAQRASSPTATPTASASWPG